MMKNSFIYIIIFISTLTWAYSENNIPEDPAILHNHDLFIKDMHKEELVEVLPNTKDKDNIKTDISTSSNQPSQNTTSTNKKYTLLNSPNWLQIAIVVVLAIIFGIYKISHSKKHSK